MAGKALTIDEKIERQTEIVAKAKSKYDEAVEELNRLVSSRDQEHREELLKAFEKSGRTYKEVMSFLKSKPAKN